MTLGVSRTSDFPDLSFATTIGLTELGYPELVLFGMSAEEARDWFVWTLGVLKRGGIPPDRSELAHAKLGYRCVFRSLDSAFVSKCHMAEAANYYKRAIQGAQLVLPDRRGRYPWQPGCDWSHSKLQSEISEWNREISH